MDNRDEATEPEPWRTRPRSGREEAERAARLTRESRTRVMIRKLVGVGIWALTLATMVAILKTGAGRDCDLADELIETELGMDSLLEEAACAAADVDTLGNVVLVAFVGLVLGIIVYVPGQRDHRPET